MKVPFFSCVEVINSKRQVNGKLGHVVQIQNYQHFQSPIQPGRVDKEPHYVDVQPLNRLYLYLFSICALFSCESVKQWWICSGGAGEGGGGRVWAFTLFVGQSEAHTATKKLFLSLGPLLLSWS